MEISGTHKGEQLACTILPDKPSRAQAVWVGVVCLAFLTPAGWRLVTEGVIAWPPFALSTVLAVVLAAQAWMGRILRMDVTRSEVTYRSVLGRTRSVPLEQVAAVLYAP